jgi:hypothetical protein
VSEFREETLVEVRFPRSKQEEKGDRSAWPWLPGTVLEQVGPDEYEVCVEVRELATLQDGSKPRKNTPPHKLYYTVCFRDGSEIRLRGAR